MTLFTFLYVVAGGIEWSLRASIERWDPPAFDPRGFCVLVACVLYGAFRVVRFHPACQPKYRDWLRGTPWNHGLPLPGGSVALGLRDVLVVILLTVLATGGPEATPLACLGAATVTYIVLLGAVNACTGCFTEAYVVAFGLTLAVRINEDVVATTTVVIVLLIVTVMGLKRSLARFPWDTPLTREFAKFFRNLGVEGQPLGWHGDPARLGFPYDACAPVSPNPVIPFRHALLLSLLVGWTYYVLTWALAPGDRFMREMREIMCYGVIPVSACLVRVTVYCGPYWPPISLLGRVATMRPIIPKYDRVFVAPLAALTVAVLLHTVFSRCAVPVEYGGAITVFAVLLILLGSGPSIGRWRMLGAYRAVVFGYGGYLTKV